MADLLGRWPTADGPLYRLLAARIARLADTGELPAGLRLPPERDLAAALSVSRNTVAAAYQLLRDEGMAESRQGAGTRIVPHRTTPGRGAPGQRLLRGPARDLRARRGPQPGRGGLRAAGGGGAGRPGLRPGPGRTPGGDQHQRVLPARAARAARRHRQPPDGPPRAACRPRAGDRHDRRPAGPGPAHPVRGAAWPAGRRRGSHLPRRARRAVPGRRPGDRDAGRRRPGPGAAGARGPYAPPGDGLPDPHPSQPDRPGHAGRAPPPGGPARRRSSGHAVRRRHDAHRAAAR